MSYIKHMRIIKEVQSGVASNNKPYAYGTAAYDVGKYVNGKTVYETQFCNFRAYGDAAEYLLKNSEKKFFKFTADNIHAGEPFTTKDGKTAVNLNMTVTSVQPPEFNYNNSSNKQETKSTTAAAKTSTPNPAASHAPFENHSTDPFATDDDPFASPGAQGF